MPRWTSTGHCSNDFNWFLKYSISNYYYKYTIRMNLIDPPEENITDVGNKLKCYHQLWSMPNF